MNKIDDFLQKIGLSKSEIKIYEGLLELGPTYITALAERVNMNRVTTLFNVRSLAKKGLVIQMTQGSKKLVSAEPPDRLADIIYQKTQTVKNLESELPVVMQQIVELSRKASKKDEGMKVKYYEGKEQVFALYKETMKANEARSFANLEKYYEVFPGTMDSWTKALENNPKRKLLAIVVDSPVMKEVKAKQHKRFFYKLLPSSKSNFFSGLEITVFDDKLAIVQLEKENVAATLIESPIVAQSVKTLHQLMWDMLEG